MSESTLAAAPPLWVRLVRVPRTGSSLEECQDAADFDLDRHRFAIADGATESWNSGIWAQMLCADYVRLREPAPAWAAWLPDLRHAWQVATDHELARDPAEMDWFLEDRYHLGAYATFLGLYLRPDADALGFSWLALAVGDSCLFQIRNDALVVAFPLERSADFNSVPWLIGSRGGDDIPTTHGVNLAGQLVPGDRLWLMTDALACWFLGQVEKEEAPWRRLQAILDGARPIDAFQAWLGEQRASQRIRNDDTTLLAITVQSPR